MPIDRLYSTTSSTVHSSSGRLVLLLRPLLLLVVTSSFLPCDASIPPPPALPAAIDLGTTLVAVLYSHGVVVGADSRTSVSGYVSHKTAHKLTPMTHHCLVARSGSAADTQLLCNEARHVCQSRYYKYGSSSVTIRQVAHLLQTMVYNAASDLSASLIVAGYDPETQQGRIYTLSSSGTLLEEWNGFAAAGSGSSYLWGYLDDRFPNADAAKAMSEDDAIEVCLQAVALAIQRDGSSGGVTRLYICNARGIRTLTRHPATTTAEKTNAPAAVLKGFAAAAATSDPDAMIL